MNKASSRKPRIWRERGTWYCNHFQQVGDAGRGATPQDALSDYIIKRAMRAPIPHTHRYSRGAIPGMPSLSDWYNVIGRNGVLDAPLVT